ncbi:hypothetical protein [Mesorhizobium sp. 131-3-5]|uniref:hypothetical protein n=1 Tax=Mesorhizobium sp. 131-3-5 TaxID=2744520 RepID=UPI00192954C5|nr:hypothetical protein [Mesorhizobium sp. 131-3-5]
MRNDRFLTTRTMRRAIALGQVGFMRARKLWTLWLEGRDDDLREDLSQPRRRPWHAAYRMSAFASASAASICSTFRPEASVTLCAASFAAPASQALQRDRRRRFWRYQG